MRSYTVIPHTYYKYVIWTTVISDTLCTIGSIVYKTVVMSALTGSLQNVLSVNPIANNSSVLCVPPVERVTEEQEGVSVEPAHRPPTSVGDVDQEQQCGECCCVSTCL